MDFSLNERQRKLVANARELAREVLAKNADRYDREASQPVDDYAALRAGGYYGMLIPEAYGGWGLDLVTCCLVSHELAQGAAATATAFNMHNFAMWNISVLGTEAQKRYFFGKVLNEGALIGGWGSEPGAGLSQGRFAIGTTITPTDDGYLVNGAKFFCTLAGVARYAEVLVVPIDRAHDVTIHDLCQMIVPADAPGVKISDDWDVLGMRATVSPAVQFDQVLLPADHMLGTPGDNILTRGLTQAISTGYAGIYTGLARAALEFAINYAARKVVGDNDARHANEPIIQQRIGELTTMVDASFALALKAAWELDHDFKGAVRQHLGGRARAASMRTVIDVTSKVFEICGGTTVANRYPVGRYFREARTMTLMNPGYDGLLNIVGKALADEAVAAQRK